VIGSKVTGPAALGVAAAVILGGGPAATAQMRPLQVRYTFQPDCFRPSLSAPCDKPRTGTRLDLGPQIAVWVETAAGRFVDTLMVTSAVATRGIGNRPGHWSLPSSPKFPYGKRPMAMPIWAHARGVMYTAVIMQDGVDKEFWLGFHEAVSSPDPYYCRPMALSEIDVDAVTCPTAVFNSVKGRLSPDQPSLPYPPRNDLRMFTDRDCDERPGPGCPMSAPMFADLNDLDAVATATPPYGRSFTGTWSVPAAVADGDYRLLLEISKEFDNNAAHSHMAFTDRSLADSGLKNNFGQPSVVFSVPFRLSRGVAGQWAGSAIAGYGEWDGRSGRMHPPDSAISEAPGSGVGRLLVIALPALRGGGTISGRLHVRNDPSGEVPPPPDGGDRPGPDGGGDGSAGADGGDGGAVGPPCPVSTVAVAALEIPAPNLKPESAEARFVEPGAGTFAAVERYQARVWQGNEHTEAAFLGGVPLDSLSPGMAGGVVTFEVRNLKAQQAYTIGVRAVGRCGEGPVAYAGFTTPVRKFTQLSGCFIATAAYGSPQAAGVAALRRLRDRARPASPLAAAAAALYERASPPLAGLLRATEGGRAVVRAGLDPVVAIVPGM
jgi:hypothetical protein